MEKIFEEEGSVEGGGCMVENCLIDYRHEGNCFIIILFKFYLIFTVIHL